MEILGRCGKVNVVVLEARGVGVVSFQNMSLELAISQHQGHSQRYADCPDNESVTSAIQARTYWHNSYAHSSYCAPELLVNPTEPPGLTCEAYMSSSEGRLELA